MLSCQTDVFPPFLPLTILVKSAIPVSNRICVHPILVYTSERIAVVLEAYLGEVIRAFYAGGRTRVNTWA